MRRDHVRLGVLAVVTLFVFPGSTLAQTTTSTDAAIAELRQLLSEQRAALDRQARIIEDQGRTLIALQQQIGGAARSSRPASARPVLAADSGSHGRAQPPAPQPPSSRTAAEPAPDLPALAVTAGDFPGSIRVPGTESAFKLGGQARLVAVHTLDALGTDDRFVTSSIPVGVARAGEEARTVYSPTASRLSTDLRMPSQRGPMRLFIESDFAGAGRAMRLRHAFLQTKRFVVGQTWSTFSDPEADPIGIDFEGLNAISRFRQPLFRWTPSAPGSRYQWALAVENPAPDLTGAQGVNYSPDFVARLRFEPGRKRGLLLYTGHLQASVLARQLRGEVSGQSDTRSSPVASAGPSAASSSRAGMRTTASSSPPTADPDRTLYRRLELARRPGCCLRPRAGQASCAPGRERVCRLRARLVAGVHDGRDLRRGERQQPRHPAEDAFHQTQRTSINLMWNPVPFVDIVVEVLAGTRINKNGQRASSSQIQSGWTLRF